VSSPTPGSISIAYCYDCAIVEKLLDNELVVDVAYYFEGHFCPAASPLSHNHNSKQY